MSFKKYLKFTKIRLIIKSFVVLGLILFFIFTLVNYYIFSYSKENIYDIKNFDKELKIGIVLGASVRSNGIPSDILKDRLKSSYNIYKKGLIKKIIVSGDNSKLNYNEPEAMEKYLINLGVKKSDIFADYAGFDTYDSLYRAKEIFGSKKILVFTQNYHLYRAVYIGNKLGIETYGINSDLQLYLGMNYFKFREYFSRIKAFLEIEIFNSKPKFLGEKIEIK